jgi:glutathione S-transferase
MDLYVNQVGTTSRAVLALVQAEGIPLRIREVDLMRGEQRSPDFLALNPNGLVPVLDDDGFVLTEAAAILRYLAQKVGSALYPTDLRERARVDEMLSWFEANLYKDLGYQYVYPQIFPHHARASEATTRGTVEWGRDRTRAWLEVLDRHFLARGHAFLASDELTIADYFGLSILSLGDLVGWDLDPYPNVRVWRERVRADASWAKVDAAFDAFAGSLRGKPFVELAAC